MRISHCLLLMFIAPLSAKDTPIAATVPYTKVNNAMVVKAHINGKGPYAFVLDTGASKTVISPKAAKKLKLRRNGKGVSMVGVAGTPIRASMSKLKELSLGKAKARRMEVVVHGIPHLNDEGIVGLLGQDFLDRFNMRFDIRNKTLTLTLPGSEKPAEDLLTPLQQQVQRVFEDPTHLLSDAKDIYLRLHGIHGSYDFEHPEPSQESARALGLEIRNKLRKLEEVDAHLRHTSYPELGNSSSNNMQRFLFCAVGHLRFLADAATMAESMALSPPSSSISDVMEISYGRLGNCLYENKAIR